MSDYTISIYDGISGETIQRELTTKEIAELEAEQLEHEEELGLREAKAAARLSALAKLADLGLTEEEVAAL